MRDHFELIDLFLWMTGCGLLLPAIVKIGSVSTFASVTLLLTAAVPMPLYAWRLRRTLPPQLDTFTETHARCVFTAGIVTLLSQGSFTLLPYLWSILT